MVCQEQAGYDWASIKVKTLVIGGEKNGPHFPALPKRAADTIRRPQLHLIPNVGHNPHDYRITTVAVPFIRHARRIASQLVSLIPPRLTFGRPVGSTAYASSSPADVSGA